MPIVTLTTDWINDDYYTGTIKGKLLALCPDLTIADISHRIPPFNTARAAFVLKNSYKHFPEGSIHLICVNSEPSGDEALLAISCEGHFFIGNDNGIFALLFKEPPDSIVELPFTQTPESFSSLDVFVNAAAQLCMGNDITTLGTVRDNYRKSVPRRATIEENVISGSVIYIDSYQNAITNITRDIYKRIGKGRKFEIALQSNHYKLNRINQTYSETSTGELLVLFNSLGLLEVAINKGNAAELLSLSTNSVIRIRFFD